MSLQWKTLTLGHLSRNKFWGESDAAQYHSVVATTTLIQTEGVRILVDPTLPVEETEALLRLHAGLGREEIDIVFATHFHGDHRVDADCYPNARLYMSAASMDDAAAEMEAVKQGRGVPAFVQGLEKFCAAPENLAPGVRLYPLPGHTNGNTGLMLDAPEGRVLITGDTIMGEEYFRAGEGYWFNVDAGKTHESIVQAAKDADLLIPGHGDWFLTEGRTDFGHTGSGCRWYRLNLGSEKEDTIVLVCDGEQKILINPCLPGPRLREALYDRRGLEPSDITCVLCLDGKAWHRQDIETLKNAKYLMPSDAMAQECEANGDVHLKCFEAWDGQFPALTIEDGCCLFHGPEGTVAVAGKRPEESLLKRYQVRVLVCGSAMCVLRK